MKVLSLSNPTGCIKERISMWVSRHQTLNAFRFRVYIWVLYFLDCLIVWIKALVVFKEKTFQVFCAFFLKSLPLFQLLLYMSLEIAMKSCRVFCCNSSFLFGTKTWISILVVLIYILCNLNYLVAVNWQKVLGIWVWTAPFFQTINDFFFQFSFLGIFIPLLYYEWKMRLECICIIGL